MKLTLEIWRQADTAAPGGYENYVVGDATPEMSLLELLDRLNDDAGGAGPGSGGLRLRLP